MLCAEAVGAMRWQLAWSRSSRSSLAALTTAARTWRSRAPSVAAAAVALNVAQQRSLRSATASSPGLPPAAAPFEVPPSADGVDSAAPHRVIHCAMVNAGRQVEVAFVDGTKYQVHASWLKDASPSNRGLDFYRTSAADVWKFRNLSASEVEPRSDGEQLRIAYSGANGALYEDIFEAKWFHALAPFVGRAMHGPVERPLVKGTGSMMRALYQNRKPWRKDVEMPTFEAAALAQDTDLQVEFLEKMVDPGIAMITGVGTPCSLEREVAGKPIEDLVQKVVGKFNQHPVRSTTYGVMRKTAESAKQGSDYDMSNPLSMHTDHSVYHGTPGFVQFLYQAEGSVRSKVCDGLALAEYVRKHRPSAFEMLTTVEMTHSSRNTLYTREGVPRSVYDRSTEAAPFELVHTHPVIQLDSDGQVIKVVQSETKRGVCALPYDIYEEFMEAYELWTQLCEDERFIKHFDWPEGTAVVTNNWRTMHGRATVPLNMSRTMAFGYLSKILVENRYRYLKQLQTERAIPAMTDRWLTRIPNQVLERLVVRSAE